MNNKTIGIICFFITLLIFIDLSNLDSTIYKGLCLFINILGFKRPCPDFYDLPFWEVGVTLGTLSAAYYAYAAIRESNKRLELEQKPHLVFSDRIITSSPDHKLHVISVKNIGKGRATNITATADPNGKNSIIEGSNPHSIDLNSDGYNNGWAIDEQRVIEGLKDQGKNVQSVINDIPDENALSENEKGKADFFLFLWYEDQLGNKYQTKATFRRSGYFLKIMKNTVSKIK